MSKLVHWQPWRDVLDAKVCLLVTQWHVDCYLTFSPQPPVARRNYPPPIFYFLFLYLFSINFIIIASLFPSFNLLVSIFLPSYVNSNLHVSTLCTHIIHGLLIIRVYRVVYAVNKKRWNNKYFFIENKYVNRKLKKWGSNSVRRAPGCGFLHQ